MDHRLRHLQPLRGIQLHCKHAVALTVIEENSRERGADQRPDTELFQPPYRMFTAGTAAKIRADQQEFRPLPFGLIEDKRRIGRAVRQKTQIEKHPAI